METPVNSLNANHQSTSNKTKQFHSVTQRIGQSIIKWFSFLFRECDVWMSLAEAHEYIRKLLNSGDSELIKTIEETLAGKEDKIKQLVSWKSHQGMLKLLQEWTDINSTDHEEIQPIEPYGQDYIDSYIVDVLSEECSSTVIPWDIVQTTGQQRIVDHLSDKLKANFKLSKEYYPSPEVSEGIMDRAGKKRTIYYPNYPFYVIKRIEKED